MPDFVEIGRSVVKILRFFVFSRWPSAILELFEIYLDNPRRVLDGLYHCAKLGYDWCRSCDNMNVSIFGTFGWKKPIHTPKNWGLWAIWPPEWAVIGAYQLKAKKTHPCVSPRNLSHQAW